MAKRPTTPGGKMPKPRAGIDGTYRHAAEQAWGEKGGWGVPATGNAYPASEPNKHGSQRATGGMKAAGSSLPPDLKVKGHTAGDSGMGMLKGMAKCRYGKGKR